MLGFDGLAMVDVHCHISGHLCGDNEAIDLGSDPCQRGHARAESALCEFVRCGALRGMQ